MAANWETWDSEYIWHPYTQMLLAPHAHGVEKAKGSYLDLADGTKVFDAISSWWLTLHGHAHPRIAKAIADQAVRLEHVIFAGFTHEPAATFAKRIIDRAPAGLTKVFFSDNGSTAVEVALKLCVQYWRHQGEARNTFLALEGAYHGDTFGAMSASARGHFTEPFAPMLFPAVHLPFPESPEDERAGFTLAEARFLDALRSHCAGNRSIAGFIYEPLLLGAGGMRVWRREVLSAALQIAKEFGIPTIADEVLTGFGRTGSFFASDKAAIAPDIMTLSKGVTGGFLPLGVTLVAQHLYDAFLSTDRTKTFFHGHSYTGNPLSSAAAVASLAIFDDEPVQTRINALREVHRERMPPLASRYRHRYRICGTMAAMEPRQAEGYMSMQSLDLFEACLMEGLLIRPLGDIIYMLPPYSSTKADLHRAYDILDSILSSKLA